MPLHHWTWCLGTQTSMPCTPCTLSMSTVDAVVSNPFCCTTMAVSLQHRSYTPRSSRNMWLLIVGRSASMRSLEVCCQQHVCPQRQQVLSHGPAEGHTISSGGCSAQLINQHQAAWTSPAASSRTQHCNGGALKQLQWSVRAGGGRGKGLQQRAGERQLRP